MPTQEQIQERQRQITNFISQTYNAEQMIICWWSGGVTSAVACKLAIDLFGIERCVFIMLGTKNEDSDTYRFKLDCEKWYGKEIQMISNDKYGAIQEVWEKFLSLNVASGAICSSELKREMRIKYQKENPNYKYQIFGFDIDEPKRARAIKLNYPDSRPIFPLLLFGYRKKDCIDILNQVGIEIPRVYKYGFHNNNCFNTGCVQGGIGYWQKMQREWPEKFNKMAEMEHRLSGLKGSPVTICKDQSDKKKGVHKPVFLLPHPEYPQLKDISMMKGRQPEPLVECNGFCGTYDLEKK